MKQHRLSQIGQIFRVQSFELAIKHRCNLLGIAPGPPVDSKDLECRGTCSPVDAQRDAIGRMIGGTLIETESQIFNQNLLLVGNAILIAINKPT
jgi:hypothetical protein